MKSYILVSNEWLHNFYLILLILVIILIVLIKIMEALL